MPRTTSTTIPNGNGSPQSAEITSGVLAAYAAEDLLKEDGLTKDNTKVRARLLEIVKQHKVLTRRDLESGSITRGQVVRELFPSLPAPPEGFSDTEDPQLAKAVWGQVYKDVWSHLTVGASGPVQILVGAAMGNGYALCRTKVGPDGTDAICVTDNPVLIDSELLEPETASLTRKIEAMLNLRSMLIMRQPQNARRYAKSGNDVLRHLQVTGKDRLTRAVEASSAESADDEPGDGE